ncbi:DUF4157 domain-containing protein [Labedaea rhizosphaerae]|uniref:Uncharacterized protein DUF4157 n=1 Tax=Labedaea rhizosphaerae TaxID=598644 RepID=A0A4R6SH79_LABRH|nr:DUF4157 domain-containing protein [Labedaea rhizosphaerae]TDQ01144.1 uncharacterized protein DUF4157 [Labedaea rhizosphaerae]
MRWAFWRRGRKTAHVVAADVVPDVAGRPAVRGHAWTQLPAFRTTIRMSAPTLVPVLRGPAVAGTRSLLHRRRPRRVITGETVVPVAVSAFPPAPSGQVEGLLTVAAPVFAEPPVEPPVESSAGPRAVRPTADPVLAEVAEDAATPMAPVPVRVVPVAGPPRSHPVLTKATDDYVGTPTAPATPFHSVTEFERMMRQYTDESGELDVAALVGFSSSASMPPAEPVVPVAAPPAPEQVLRRPTLAESRKLGLRRPPVTAADDAEPVAEPADEAAIDVPPEPAVPVEPAREESTVEVAAPPTARPAPPRRLGLGAPVPSRPDTTLTHRRPFVPARQRQVDTPAAPRQDEPDDTEHDQAPAQPVRLERLQAEPPIVEQEPLLHEQVHAEPVATELIHPAPPQPAPPHPDAVHPGPVHPGPVHPAPFNTAPTESSAVDPGPPDPPATRPAPDRPPAAEAAAEQEPGPVPTFAEPVYRAPLAVLPPPAAPESATWYEQTRQVVPSELVSVFMTTFGVDVTDVPVHRGRSVSRQARALTARAFTRAGQVYLPDEVGELTGPEAKPLLAHELVHAVQQQVLGEQLPGADTAEGHELEEAAVTAERWVRGESAPPLTLLHRQAPARPAPDAGNAAPVQAPDNVQLAENDAVAAFLEMAREERREDTEPAPVEHEVTKVASWALPESHLPFPASQSSMPATVSTSDQSAVDQAVLTRLAQLDAAVTALTEKHQERDAEPADATSMQELADRLYGRLRNRLRAELLVDRERAGTLADRR